MDHKTWSTNDFHYQIFKSECEYWLEKYGLFEWEVMFRHNNIKNRASCEVREVSKICLITFGTKWPGVEPTLEKIGASAYHEVLELMLHELTSMSKRECCIFEDNMEEKLHSVIKRLENVHWVNDRREHYKELARKTA